MEVSTIEDVVAYLRKNKKLFHDRFGVTRMGIFGSFARYEQSDLRKAGKRHLFREDSGMPRRPFFRRDALSLPGGMKVCA